MGLADRLIPQSLKGAFSKPTEQRAVQGFKTFTEYTPTFSSFNGSIYEKDQTRAIIECIATSCSKLKPEFVTPEGSAGSLPRVQRLVTSWPNDMQTWDEFLKLVVSRLLVDTTAYIVPGYDERDHGVVALYSMKPSYAEVIEYDGEPWIRFHLPVGEPQAFPFYDVAILTRFQMESDIFGGGNRPLTPTLRLMDAQRQAEEIALQTGADIRFIGKLTTITHEDDVRKKRDRFAESNLSSANKSGLMLYDSTIEDLKQVQSQHYTIDPEEMERIDKSLYAYFTINEKILNGSYTEQEWAAFYESCIEPKAIMIGNAITKMLLTPTQVRKGNRFMLSSSYLEYATPESKLKVVSAMLDRGVYTFNQALDVFQLPHVPGGDVRMIRGEYYLIDKDNNIIAESGGRTDHETNYVDDDDGEGDDVLDDAGDLDGEDEIEKLSRELAKLAQRSLKSLPNG